MFNWLKEKFRKKSLEEIMELEQQRMIGEAHIIYRELNKWRINPESYRVEYYIGHLNVRERDILENLLKEKIRNFRIFDYRSLPHSYYIQIDMYSNRHVLANEIKY